jgi:hypothetical protein
VRGTPLALVALVSAGVGPCDDRTIGALAADGASDSPGSAPCLSVESCRALALQYGQAVSQGRSCTLGADHACSISVPGTLRCGGTCPTFVGDAAALEPLRMRWRADGCDRCFAAEPCPPCIDPGAPTCTPGAGVTSGSTQGSCEDTVNPRICPPGLATGAPCALPVDHCIGGGHAACLCTAGSPTWSCS